MKLNDLDDCYKNLRINNQNLLIENNDLRLKLKELSNISNTNKNHNSNNKFEIDNPSSVRFKSPNVNKKQMNFNSDCMVSNRSNDNIDNQ